MTPVAELVWMSTLRRGLHYHLLWGQMGTCCGRYVGKIGDPLPNPAYRAAARGNVLELGEAVGRYEATPCPRCTEASA